jgi:hypothetical protein
MGKESQRDRDLEEIFLRVNQIRAERELDPVVIIQDNVQMTAGELDSIPPEDIFEIVEIFEDFPEKISTKMINDSDSNGTCDICSKEIIFEENLSGLVVQGKFFSCEKCCNDASKDALNNWAKSKTTNLKEVKPIALWLMEEKNKTSLF